MNETPIPVPDQARLSIACALGGSLAFSINDITVKSFSGTLPLHEVVLFRALVALIVTVAVFAPDKSLAGVFRTRRLSSHMFRGLCVVVSNLAYFAALAALPLAETSAIFFIAPLLITALSAILLREHVGPWRWAALGIGMIGVLLIVKPGTAAFQWAVLLPAVAALAYAGMHTMTRKMGLAESAAISSSTSSRSVWRWGWRSAVDSGPAWAIPRSSSSFAPGPGPDSGTSCCSLSPAPAARPADT